jgi:HEAT repeat protein
MRPTNLRRLLLALIVVGLGGSASYGANNPIRDAVQDMDSGNVRFSFAARPGVTGDGHNVQINHGSGSVWRRWNDSGTPDCWCDPCDLQVTLSVRDDDIRRVRWRIGVSDRGPRGELLDLGRQDATTARDFLMQVVQTGDDRVAEDALEAAVLSHAGVPWRELLALARDAERTPDLRSTALFWLGQEAQEVVTDELEDFVDADIEDRKVRKAAVFALSQRPERESIPSLERIARQHRDAEIRRTALFWLAQKDDPEVLDFFEEILSGSQSH